MKNKKGFIFLLTMIFMMILTVFTGTLMYMATADIKNSTPQSDDVNLTGLADAGIDKAHRAISDDYAGSAPSPGSRTGIADLRGDDTSLSTTGGSGITNPANMEYIDGVSAIYPNNNTAQAIIRTFDSNYTNTRIISVVPHIGAAKNSTGNNATIVLAYTTDGSSYTTVLTQALPNSTTIVDYTGTAITGLTWPIIMSSNFRLRMMRTSGGRAVNIDSMYLRVTYGIDTLKELWATGGYASLPISLSGGTIQSITITDEESKVHLNYALTGLLTNLLTNLGIAGASTKSADIITYRNTKLFDTVEELQKVSSITPSDYANIKDHVTVYSFINSNVYRPTGPRAPININTAPFEVLKAVFDPLALTAGESTTLANDIISFRNSTPFQGFYTSASTTDNTYFYNFVNSRAYLTIIAPLPHEKDRVWDNSDASSMIPFANASGVPDTAFNAITTEFCYASTVFYIETVVSLGGRNLRVKTLRGNNYDPSRTDASRTRTFRTYSGDTTFSGWRKENFE